MTTAPGMRPATSSSARPCPRHALTCCLVGSLILFVIVMTEKAQSQDVNLVGNVAVTITTGIPNGQPVPVQDVTSRLRYRRQTVVTKITVATSCPAQHFALSVLATAISHGTAAPEVTLTNGMPETDFIRDIPARAGGSPQADCTLRYTASATFAQGNSVELGPDVHTVRYTLIAQ